MDDNRALLTNLILAVCHLCDRTRGLSMSGSRDPRAVVPVREAVGMVLDAMETLRASWEPGALPPCLPSDGLAESGAKDSWLLGDEDSL